MYIAISAIVASVAVVLTLSALITDKSISALNAMLNFHTLSANDASSTLLYCAVVFAVTFSVTLFVLRFVGLFLAALGLPNEDQIRRNRELRRLEESQKRQAQLTAHYVVRLQADAAQQAARRRSGTGPLVMPDLDIKSR